MYFTYKHIHSTCKLTKLSVIKEMDRSDFPLKNQSNKSRSHILELEMNSE
jgi:hypothetical protein